MMESEEIKHVDESPKLIFGWGNTSSGQLGVGGIEEDYLTTPTKLKFCEAVKSVSCGETHTVIVLKDGTLYTCGSNDFGQLGHSKSRTRPEKVEGLEGRFIVRASAGFSHTLAIDQWGTLLAWGSDSCGQLGLGLASVPAQDRYVSFPKTVKGLATKVVVQVAAGHSHSVVLTNVGEIYTFGSNSHGQLGLGFSNGLCQTKPCLVEMLVGFPTALISTGDFHSFALSVSGSVFGWGKNICGQIGVSDNTDKCQPTQLTTLRSLGVRYITAGADHSVFLTQDGGVFTCGNGSYGQLGHASLNNEVLPRKILEFGSVIIQVSCGKRHTLCLTENNRLYSFGLGSHGQLGLQDTASKSNPVQVLSAALVSSIHEQIFAGGDQSFVVVNTNPELPAMKDYREYEAESQILTFTEERIHQIYSAVEPVDQDVMTLAESIFAYPSIWNASFLKENRAHVPSTWKNIGIDLEQAERVFSKLSTMSSSSSLPGVIEQVIFKELLPRLPHQLKHVEVLRIYVLLPLMPLFHSGSNPILPILFSKRIQSLPQDMSSVVVNWMYNSPIEQIQRLISVYKRAIIAVIDAHQPQSQKDSAVGICLNLLSVLNRMNKQSLKLSYHTFNIPQLLSKIDIKLDYISWLKKGNTKGGLFFCDYPFVFDAQAKTTLLQTDQILQMQDAMNKASTMSAIEFVISRGATDPRENQFLNIQISRSSIVHDTITVLSNLTTHDLKKPLKVKFIGEEGEDAGGVKKEFFLLLIREILDPKYGMFRNYEESRLMWFNEESFEDPMMYYIIGLLCGLAIYNFTIINLPFPLALYKKLLDEKVDLHDFKELNPTVGRSFEQMMEYNSSDLEEVFSLTFEISQETFGTMKVTPLKANGNNIPVTNENKNEFIELYISYILNVCVRRQFDAFKRGFDQVCGSTVLPLFHALELQAMVTGNEDYDWGELERNCTYKNYTATDPTIILFWEVFHELSLAEKKQFLLFLTGNDRIPITGMKSLKIVIQPTADEKFLPVAHTCFNLLDLPKYQTKERLRYKLLQAIQFNQGFTIV